MSKYKLTDGQKQRVAQYEWLTDRERLVFEAYYRHGANIEDIAAELDVNRSTVDRDLRNIRKCAGSFDN